MLLFTLFSVGIFTSYIDGGNFYSEEELLKKFPPPTPRPTNFPQTISSTPEKFDQVFYALSEGNVSELHRFEQKPYSYNNLKNRIVQNGIYFSSGTSLLRLDLTNNQPTVVHELSPEDAYLHFAYDSNKNVFHFTTFKKDASDEGEINQQLIQFNPLTGEQKEITSFVPGAFKLIKHLFSVNDTDIIYTAGGEACGGGGSIYAVQNKNRTLIKDYGIGCLEGSRLLGADEDRNSLIMAEVLIREDDTSKADVKRIFRKNVADGSEETLLTIDELGFTEQELSDDQKKVILKSENTVLVFDLDSKVKKSYAIEEGVLRTSYLNSLTFENDICLVADDYERKKLKVFCLETLLNQELDYGTLGLSSPQIYGFYDKKLIFSASKEKSI